MNEGGGRRIWEEGHLEFTVTLLCRDTRGKGGIGTPRSRSTCQTK